MPALWKGMYERCKNEGFTEEQALKVVCAYVHGFANGKLQ